MMALIQFLPMATNDFVGIDESPLSENGMWLPNAAATLVGRMKRLSNTAQFTANSDSATLYNKIMPDNQYAQAQFTCVGATGAGDGPALVLRCPVVGVNTLYRFALDHTNGTNADIAKFTNGAYVSLKQGPVTFNDGDTFTFAVEGQVLYAYRNFVLVLSYDNSQGSGPSSGLAGIGFSSPETSITIRQFECGAFSTAGFTPQEVNTALQEFNKYKRDLVALQTVDRKLALASAGSR